MNTQATELKTILTSAIADLTGMPTEEVDSDANFMTMGIDSLDAMKVFKRVQDKLGIRINPIVMFECQTINQLVDYITSNFMEA